MSFGAANLPSSTIWNWIAHNFIQQNMIAIKRKWRYCDRWRWPMHLLKMQIFIFNFKMHLRNNLLLIITKYAHKHRKDSWKSFSNVNGRKQNTFYSKTSIVLMKPFKMILFWILFESLFFWLNTMPIHSTHTIFPSFFFFFILYKSSNLF